MTTLLAGDVEGDDANLPEVHLRIPYSQHLSSCHAHHLQKLHTSVSNKLHEAQSLLKTYYMFSLFCPDDGPAFICVQSTSSHTIWLRYILICLSKLCLHLPRRGGVPFKCSFKVVYIFLNPALDISSSILIALITFHK